MAEHIIDPEVIRDQPVAGERWTCGRCRVGYLKARPWHFSEIERWRCEVPGCAVRYACSSTRRDKDVVVLWLL